MRYNNNKLSFRMISWQECQLKCGVCKHFLTKGRQDNRVPIKIRQVLLNYKGTGITK